MEIKVSVSVGELVDKLTILEIKSANIPDEEKRKNILLEEELLRGVFESKIATMGGASLKKLELKAINLELWDVEDRIRDLERSKNFGKEFIELARSVYQLNDKRAQIKKEINLLCGSTLIEEKSYAKY